AERRDRGPGAPPGVSVPRPGGVPAGCASARRGGLAEDRASGKAPPMYEVSGTRRARCHYHELAPTLPRATPADVRLPEPDAAAAPVISLRGVSKTFAAAHGERVHALAGVGLDLRRGETRGLVGESGSGKTTLARVLLGLTAPDEGSTVELEGKDLAPDATRRGRDQLRAMQIVFQNPDSALNRRHSVRYLIGRALTKLAGVSG